MELLTILHDTGARIVARVRKAKLGRVTARFRNWALFPNQSETRRQNTGGRGMLRWALGFFIVALIAALLGFTGISVAAAGIAKILFYLFLILFLITLMGHLLRRS
jgi:uncharacterized membrane protein YtjA (UPF0391 family)